MEQQQYEIECGRCGETKLEFLTEEEAKVTSEGIGPAYRHCERCGKITGWIKARTKHAAREEAGAGRSDQSVGKMVPYGEERIATSSERAEVNAILRRPDVL